MSGPRLRGVLVALLSLSSLVVAGLPAGAQNQPPQTIFTCLPDSVAVPIYEPQTIACTISGPSGNIAGEDILGEILEGGVSDTDGTTSPPDFTGISDSNGTISFPFEGAAAGIDKLCFWYESNNVPDDINEGDNQCVEDANSELVEFEWQAADQVPALNVRGEGLTKDQAKTLMDGFGLKEKWMKDAVIGEDGTLLYVDDKRFQRIPHAPMDGDPQPEEDGMEVSLDGILIGLLEELDPISDKTARNRTERAFGNLKGAAVDYFTPRGGRTRLIVENGEFELLPAFEPNELQRIQHREQDEVQLGNFEIDTTISWEQTFNEIPLVGPGANFRASFDPSGRLSMVNLAARGVRVGKEIPIMNEASALDACEDEVEEAPQQSKAAQVVDLDVELVYYAPPLDLSVEKIYPHYECTGTVEVDGVQIDIRPAQIPAPVFTLPPRIDIDISAEGPTVTALAEVEGGTPPYSYSWSSVFNEIPEGVSTTGSSIVYDAENRGEEFLDYEIVKLVVTDSEGFRVTDYALVRVSPLTSDILAETRGISFGASYVGAGYAEGSRLRHPDANSRGFRDTLDAAGVEHNYFLGDRSVFESDFSDTEVKPSGSDEVWADNTDMFWFTGHANGDGFLLSEGSDDDDAFVGFNDVRWGDRDLEFATIAACGPLQDMSSGLTLQARWGPVFQGLHILNGYSTVSQDGTEEGRTFAQHLVGTGDLVPRYVRHAWSLAAIAVQPPDVIHGSMGVVATTGASSISDYFWGFGSTSPDIRGGDIAGYWVLRYPS